MAWTYSEKIVGHFNDTDNRLAGLAEMSSNISDEAAIIMANTGWSTTLEQKVTDRIDVLKQSNDRQEQPITEPALRIGIATGQVIAGYTCTQRRATYTCVGDTVKLAARLEAYTKIAQKSILIDEATRQSLSEAIKVEDLGTAEIKGKNQEVKVYSILVE